MTVCSQCGNEVSEGAKFCPNCGASMSSSQTVPALVGYRLGRQEMESTPSSMDDAGQPPANIRNIAMLWHVAAFAGYIGIPFGNIVGPLLVWLLKREESPFIDVHGKQALNFQISATIYAIISTMLIFCYCWHLLTGNARYICRHCYDHSRS
jgi:hypothetical protein